MAVSFAIHLWAEYNPAMNETDYSSLPISDRACVDKVISEARERAACESSALASISESMLRNLLVPSPMPERQRAGSGS